MGLIYGPSSSVQRHGRMHPAKFIANNLLETACQFTVLVYSVGPALPMSMA